MGSWKGKTLENFAHCFSQAKRKIFLVLGKLLGLKSFWVICGRGKKKNTIAFVQGQNEEQRESNSSLTSEVGTVFSHFSYPPEKLVFFFFNYCGTAQGVLFSHHTTKETSCC